MKYLELQKKLLETLAEKTGDEELANDLLFEIFEVCKDYNLNFGEIEKVYNHLLEFINKDINKNGFLKKLLEALEIRNEEIMEIFAILEKLSQTLEEVEEINQNLKKVKEEIEKVSQ